MNSSTATTKGIEGEIEAQYVIIPKKRGDLKISTEAFSYFDPKEEKYMDLGSQVLTLNAVNAQDIANAKTTLQKVNEYTNTVLEKVDSPVMSTEKLKVKQHKKINWLVIFGNLLIIGVGAVVFVYFNKRYRDKKAQNLEKKKLTSQPIVTIAETESLLRNSQTFDIQSHLNYLQRTIDNDNTAGFFQAFEELKLQANQYYKNKNSLDFSDYLKTNFGLSAVEKYNQLITKINIEKYSPFSSR